ncbi:MAG: response regulator [Planctomycetes bacterium]|nr:response regulator [Planctomycetota bacterium]
MTIGHEIAAEVELHRDRPAEAAEHVERGTAQGGARGLPDRDVQLTHLRLRLATARKDDAAITACTQELDRMRRDETGRYRGFAAILEHLLTDERQRVAMERQLAGERDAAARAFRTTVTTASVALAVLLGLCTWLTLRSRRRLAAAHAALQAEVEHTAAESAARRQLEQRLRQMERVESLGMVAGGVAHDFNNLMVAVLGNADLLRTDVHDPEARQLLDAITAAGQRGARLCSDLQAFAADRSRDTDELDLVRLLRDLVPVLQAAAGPSVQVALEADPNALPLTGNATELEQALLNLITNARDAKAKQVTLRTTRVERTEADWRNERAHGAAAAGAFACIEVQDDGEGMREELVERIFDPFFTTRFPGRGLGLAVVSGALRRHRGAITIDSAVGRGTTFRLHLPLVMNERALPSGPEAPPKLQAHAEPMTVVVVDDEANVREVVAAALGRRGHRVVTVGEGARVAEAMRELAGASRLVALVDLTMPGMDGRDVVHLLHRDFPGVPIVLMSGHAADHLAATTEALRVAGHVGKPFLPNELEQALATAVAAVRRLQPPAVAPAHSTDARTAAS